MTTDGLPPEAVRIDREYWLGSPGVFADIRVAPAGLPPYFVEVKYGYSNERLVRHLGRKYTTLASTNAAAACKVVLVVDRQARAEWERIERDLASQLAHGLQLEVWDESRLAKLLADRRREQRLPSAARRAEPRTLLPDRTCRCPKRRPHQGLEDRRAFSLTPQGLVLALFHWAHRFRHRLYDESDLRQPP